MRLLPFQLLSLALSVLTPVVDATSRARNPLSSISTVQNATIHTHNRRVTALSDFELTFITADDLHVKFHLEPNHDILASGASFTHLSPDGTVARHQEVTRLEHKVFKGTAWIRQPSLGQEQWENVGWARTMVHVDGKHPKFEGSFSVHHVYHHIQSSANYLRTRHHLDPTVELTDDNGDQFMVLWRDSDIVSNAAMQAHQDLRRGLDIEAASCSSDRLSFNTNPDHPVFVNMRKRAVEKSFGSIDLPSLFGKRQSDTTTGGNSAGVNLTSTIGQSAGCPSPRKVALVGVAADCNYLQTFDSVESARTNIIQQINSASAVWEGAFNISLGLHNLTTIETSSVQCPTTPNPNTAWDQACSDSVDIQDRLNLFSQWRGTYGGNVNSHWTLLSTCNTGSTIGLAWLGQACVNTAMTTNSSSTGNGQTSGAQSETVSGANVVISTKGTNEWQIIAHETGHTFGAVHDCDSDTCANTDIVNSQQCCPLSSNSCNANAKYIMNPYASEGVSAFSACTVGNICSAIGRNSVNTACLTDNREVNTISGQQCGNGIVEPGEECDCGGDDGCGNDPCCDAQTCKFKAGAVCDDANESCCHNCQLATNGTVCRASTGPCDPQEVCSGSSPNCPADQTTPDGTSCGNSLQCASGQCTSRDQQCKTVMGSYTQGNDTYACSSSGCSISCASPEFSPGTCYSLQQNFLDGTICGGGGHCNNGQCDGSSFGGEVKSWIDDHKGVVIGVCAAVGGLLLIAVLTCLWSCCARRRGRGRGQARNKISSAAPIPQPMPGGWQGWNRAQPPPPEMSQQQYESAYYAPSQNWQNGNPGSGPSWGSGSGNNGPSWGSTPVPPPPAFGNRGQSVRYA